jgi:hypothetical protein
MIRNHIRHIRAHLDEQSIPVRGAVTVGALVSLPLLGNGVRTVGSALDLGMWTLPLLAIAHVPAVIALIAIWSIVSDVRE